MPELSTGLATRIITHEQFDYFESERQARDYVAFANLDPSDISQAPLGYTKVPRLYSPYLDVNLDDAITLFDAPEAQPFVQIDRQDVIVGQTDAGSTYDTGPALLIPPHERSCSLLLNSGDVVGFEPRRNRDIEDGRNVSVEVPLGKHILTPDSSDTDYSLTIYDSFREWERVLIVGETAIRKFMHMSFNEEHPGIGNKERAARIGQVGAILYCEEKLGRETDFRAFARQAATSVTE